MRGPLVSLSSSLWYHEFLSFLEITTMIISHIYITNYLYVLTLTIYILPPIFSGASGIWDTCILTILQQEHWYRRFPYQLYIAGQSVRLLMAKKLNKFGSHLWRNSDRAIVFIKPHCCGLCFQDRLLRKTISQLTRLHIWLKITFGLIDKPLDLAACKWSDQNTCEQLRCWPPSPLRQTCLHSVYTTCKWTRFNS